MRHSFTSTILASALMLLALAVTSSAEAELLMDRGRQVEGLWLFPDKDDPVKYRYLPQTARLSRNENGDPQFSLTFFVDDEPQVTEGASAISSIGTASGGAILHVLLEYDTDADLIKAAQSRLRRDLDNDEAVIEGPVIFDSGTFSVVSSVLSSEGARSATVLAQRPAPVLEGQSVAQSYQLTPQLANILLSTMRTDTPDFSVTFELMFHGLSDSYDAEMVIDWQKTKNSMQAAAGINIYVVALDAEAAIEKAFQDGAIKLVVNGDDAAMESLVELAYSKAMDIMYAPIEIDDVPEDQRGGMMDALGTMLGEAAGSAVSSAIGIGISASYRMKDLRNEGTTTLSFEKAGTVHRAAMLTMNLGDFYSQYGDNEKYVRVESTADCDFAQRRIFVLVDGALRPDVGAFVNNIGLSLKKQHESGAETIRELMVNTQNLSDDLTLGPLTYNSNGDTCDEQWLDYQYRTDWSFVGGGQYASEWLGTSAASVSLTAPYHRQVINIGGDMQALMDKGVRAVVVQVSSDFFGRTVTQRRTFQPDPGAAEIEPISIIQPEGHYQYQYDVRLILHGGEQITDSGTDDLGYLFLDEIADAG